MKLSHYIPSDILKPFIGRMEIHESARDGVYKVFPGTGLVLGFQYKGRVSVVHDETVDHLSPSGVTGIQDSFRVFANSENTGSVLVYFKEGGASQFFRQPLHELFSTSVSLDNFMLRSELLVFEDELCEAKTDSKRIAVVEKFLISRLKNSEVDKLVMAAIAIIHRNKGMMRVSALSDELNISQGPLEKRFRKVIGTSPKKFATIVRMRSVIENYDPNLSLTEIGLEAGFYDQAHFIKEFKMFTGDTPNGFLKKK